MKNMIVDDAKVMAKGQVTLPKEILDKLGLSSGDHVIFICKDDQVVMMNAAIYGMKILQKSMKGVGKELDTDTLVKEIRDDIAR